MTRTLFGTDGMRGIAGEYPLDVTTLQAFGYSASRVLASSETKKTVVIGRDTRASGSWIFDALVRGLNAGGMDVLDAGVVPTPLVSVLTKQLQCASGIVISASHNPYEYNGIKFFSSTGEKLPDEVEAHIERGMVVPCPVSDTALRVENIADEMYDVYKTFLLSTLPASFSLFGMKFVIDCAHGALSCIAPRLFKELGANVITLHAEPDGKNINHDCGSLHRDVLSHTVVHTEHAMCGFAFDGDGDRVLFTDENGVQCDGDHMMALLADDLHHRQKLAHNTLVITLMSNLGLRHAMAARGIAVEETAVGDRYVYQRMCECGACLGGEQSGHIIARDFAVTGDGMLTALHVLRVVHDMKKPFSECVGIMQKFPQILVNVKIKEKKDLQTIPVLRDALHRIEQTLGSEGRVVIRYSGTEPLVRIMIEGRDSAHISSLAHEYASLVKQHLG